MEKSLGERIRQARVRYGMSQAELARRIGISKTSMNEIERGETHDPRFSVVEAIARTLGMSLDDFASTVQGAQHPPSKRSRRRVQPQDEDEEALAHA
jgi:putative transcriptional regulator